MPMKSRTNRYEKLAVRFPSQPSRWEVRIQVRRDGLQKASEFVDSGMIPAAVARLSPATRGRDCGPAPLWSLHPGGARIYAQQRRLAAYCSQFGGLPRFQQ